MLEKLQLIEARYNELSQQLARPEVYENPAAITKISREQKELAPIVAAYQSYCQRKTNLEEAKALLDTALEPDFRDMVLEEYETAQKDLDRLEEEVKVLLLPSDPNDRRSVILEIRGGAGGEEAALFANSLYRMYSMYAERRRWHAEIVNLNETELGGIKEISCTIEGEGAYSRLKFESGVHRVQRVPETESSGRVHTSTVTVAVLPEAEEVELEINPGDLQIDTFRASGAGGQHVNKTESAIRITHVPTGTAVECQEERSQHKNRERAMKILRAKLLERMQQEQAAVIAADRRSQVGTGMRNERIRTYNFPQGRITDHRIGLTLYKIDAIMDGDLDEMIEALITADQAEKLRANGEA